VFAQNVAVIEAQLQQQHGERAEYSQCNELVQRPKSVLV
jgi:hypothetical protein